ncbi:MAG: DUF1223 domain-containing protein [Aurantibacter sp.]
MVKNILLKGLVLSLLLIISMGSISSKDIEEDLEFKKIHKTFEPFVVLELFTSQGCSSCPPADALLEKSKKEHAEGVFALSYHVDYWNYIGWEDPFSKASYGQKQSKYNNKLRNRSNYTPQIVANGQEHFVGSDVKKMNATINKYLAKQAPNSIQLMVTEERAGKISFKYGVEGAISGKHLRGVLALDKRVTAVKRGENRSRTLSNSNIVVAEKSFVLNEAMGSEQFEIPELVKPGEKLHLILLLENDDYDIFGAAKVEIIK